jgi:hypothetical protein
MYDKDVLLLQVSYHAPFSPPLKPPGFSFQAAAANLDPDEFILQLLARFGLTKWATLVLHYIFRSLELTFNLLLQTH